jgi:glutathione S-transferase
MKLYIADYAPNPRRVRWIMAEKGITDIAVEPLDIMSHQHKTHPSLLATGMPVLPVLELDDGTLLAESVAIGRYLESLYPAPNLFGRDPLEIARIEMWLRRIEQNFATPLMLGTRLTHPALKVLEAANPDAADYFLKAAGNFAAVLDRQLDGRDFIITDRLTIADIAAICALDFARIIRFRPDREHPNLGRWVKAMRERPAADAAP